MMCPRPRMSPLSCFRFCLRKTTLEQAFAELVPKPEVGAMAEQLGKHKDGKGVDSGGLPVPPSVAIDLSACQVGRVQVPIGPPIDVRTWDVHGGEGLTRGDCFSGRD